MKRFNLNILRGAIAPLFYRYLSKFNIQQISLFLTSLFFIFILWIIYLADIGQKFILFDLKAMIPFGDKIGHLIIFGLLAFGLNYAFNFKKIKFGSSQVFFSSMIVLFFALTEECSQCFFPKRQFEILDLIADVIGVILFSKISLLLMKRSSSIQN